VGTINSTFVIEKKAQRLFVNALPPKWLIREQSPDVHIDYFIEIVEESEPTGLLFGTQLKGTASARYTSKYIKYSFEKKHLAYYVDKVKQAVFLVVVDVNEGKGYWLFAQKNIINELRPNWRRQKNVELKIPLHNELGNIDQFLKEIKEADVFMRDLWPGSVAAAVQKEQQKLKGMDDRFNVNVNFENGVTRYKFSANENIIGHMHINGKEGIHKLEDLIKRGRTVTFEPGEFSMSGSKLFDSFTEDFMRHGVLVEASKTVICDAELSIINPNGDSLHVIHALKAEMKGGSEEVAIHATLPDSPLTIYLERTLNVVERPDRGEMKFSLNLEKWVGQAVRILSHFEQLYRFVQLVDEGNSIKLSFSFHGNELFSGTTRPGGEALFIRECLPKLKNLDDVRVVCRKLNLDPILPPLETLEEDKQSWLHLYRKITEQGEYKEHYEGVVSGIVVVNKSSDLVSTVDTYRTIKLVHTKVPIYIFEDLVDIRSFEHVFTNIKLSTSSKNRLNVALDGDEIEVELEATEGTEHIIVFGNDLKN